MARIAALELEKDLGAGGLRPVYALVGEDDFLVRRCLSLLRGLAEAPDSPGGMATEFGADADASRVFDELRTAPFMGLKGKRLVVLRDGQGFMTKHGEALARYLQAPASTSSLVVCCPQADARGGKPRRPGKGRSGDVPAQAKGSYKGTILKQIGQEGLVVDCGKLRWREAERWVRTQAEQLGNKFTPRASALLLEAVGADLAQLDSEVAKLVDYAADSPVIDERAVEDLVPQSRTLSIFEISDAVTRGNAARAFHLCQHLLLRGEELTNIISILARRTRQLWQMKRLNERGTSQKDIAGQMKVPPFVVSNSLEVLSGISEAALATHLSVLADADYELKTSAIAPREEEAWLIRLVAKLCQSAR